MKSSVPILAVSIFAIAFGVAGACSFPDVDTAEASGGGGATASGTTLAGTTEAAPGSTGSTTTTSSTVSTATTATDVGGGTTTSSTSSTGDGGAGSTTDGVGGSTGSSGGGGSSSTLTGVGGGVVDVACGNGCVPFPSGVGGGAPNDDCDGDGDDNVTDCQPCDPQVFHLQTGYFAAPFTPFEAGADPSFDYDCSGADEYDLPYVVDGCSSLDTGSCADSDIYVSSTPPICGVGHTKQACHVTGLVLGECTNDGGASSVTVKCH